MLVNFFLFQNWKNLRRVNKIKFTTLKSPKSHGINKAYEFGTKVEYNNVHFYSI